MTDKELFRFRSEALAELRRRRTSGLVITKLAVLSSQPIVIA